jgi:hypothetical protein
MLLGDIVPAVHVVVEDIGNELLIFLAFVWRKVGANLPILTLPYEHNLIKVSSSILIALSFTMTGCCDRIKIPTTWVPCT